MKFKLLVVNVVFCTAFQIVFCSALQASEKDTNVAVVDFSGRNIENQDAATFSDLLRTHLVQSGKYTVLEKAHMDKLLDEMSFQQTGVTNAAYVIQVGKILNVQKMVVGTVSKIDAIYYVNSNIVDVESGKIDRSEVVQGNQASEFMDMSRKLAMLMTDEAKPNDPKKNLKNSAGDNLQRQSKNNGSNAKEKPKFALGVGNPYFSCSYDLSENISIEPRFASNFSSSDPLTIYGLRMYYIDAKRAIGVCYGLELDSIDFQDEESHQRSGVMGGVFVGCTWSISRNMQLLADIGPYFISLHNAYTTGFEWIVNTGLRVYIF